MKKVLLTATVQSHIAQFHKPLIKILKENNYEVHVAARNNLKEKNGLKIEEVDQIIDIPFERNPLKKNNLKAYKELKALIEENHYDIVHCNTPMGGIITRLATKKIRKEGTKVIYTAHGFHFYEGAPLKNWLLYYPIEKMMAHYTDILITITQEDFNLACRKNFKTMIKYVPGVGVDEKKYYSLENNTIKNELRRKLGYDEDEFILVCTGELNRNKNQISILKAIPRLKKQIPKLRLLLAGNGGLENKLRKVCKELSIEENVVFLGYRIDLEQFIQISDVVISMSYREGLPMNIMEAMCCSKPVIASHNRGHRELIKDNITGYLILSDEIHEKVLKLYSNEELRKEMGENGNKTSGIYSSNFVSKEIEKIYAEINI